MSQLPTRHLAGLSLLLILAGCAPTTCGGIGGVSQETSAEVLPACARGEFKADLPGPAMLTAAAETLGRPAELPIYRCLGALECQCRAAQVSTLSNLLGLEQQARAAQQTGGLKLGKRAAQAEAELTASVLRYTAFEDQNQSAAKALDTYYQLGAAEANRDILKQLLASVDAALAKARNLKAQGLAGGVDDAKLYRQQLDLQAQSVQLDLQIDQLNGDLRTLLAYAPCGPAWRIWPTDAFEVVIEPIDLEAAIALGREHRPELILLTALERELNSDNAGAVRTALRAANALLGKGKAPSACPKLHLLLALLCSSADDEELDILRRQVHVLHAQKEREVVQKIGQSVRSIQGEMEVVVLARKQVESWQTVVREAKEKEGQGLGSFAETAEATAEWLRARRRIVEEVSNLQRARVQLRQAQGTLIDDCHERSDP